MLVIHVDRNQLTEAPLKELDNLYLMGQSTLKTLNKLSTCLAALLLLQGQEV